MSCVGPQNARRRPELEEAVLRARNTLLRLRWAAKVSPGAAAASTHRHTVTPSRYVPGPPRPVLLVDDVLTTGATLARAARALAGTPWVPVAALMLASAPPPRKEASVMPAGPPRALL